MEESNAELDKCMKDWEDLSAEYLVINAVNFHNGSLDVLVYLNLIIIKRRNCEVRVCIVK